ncbi:hypothetical protein PTKIN_Ptkin09bG0190000 [Pterospermum kingtungense]
MKNSGSKAAKLKVRRNQKNQTPVNISKGIKEVGPPSASSPPSVISTGDPALLEALQMQKKAVHISPFTLLQLEDLELKLRLPPQPDDQMNAKAGIKSNALHEQGNSDESFHHHPSSDENPMQPTLSGLEGSDSSSGDDATDDHQQTTSSSSSPLILEPRQSFPLALAEKIPQSGSHAAQSFYSQHDVNSVQANPLNIGHVGSSLQDELLTPQRVEQVNRGKTVLFDDQFEPNNGHNNFNDNQQAVTNPNLFPQSPGGIGLLNGGSSQINQQASSWLLNRDNDPYRPLASSGSQVNNFSSTNNSEQLCHNFMLPRSSLPSRPWKLNSPQQLQNQVHYMPNASDSLLQHSMLTKPSLAFQLMPQHVSYEQNQVPMAPRTYNPQTCSTMLTEPSMSFRSSIPPLYHEINPFNVSDLPYRSSVLSRLQTDQQQGLVNQTARPIATYPTSGTSLSSLILNSSLHEETGGTSAPHQIETSLSNHEEEEQRGQLRSRFEVGESSSFKRFKREYTVPQASIAAEQVHTTSSTLQNEATSSNGATLYYPRPIRNSVYDPLYEGIGLPIDPHLRMFLSKDDDNDILSDLITEGLWISNVC